MVSLFKQALQPLPIFIQTFTLIPLSWHLAVHLTQYHGGEMEIDLNQDDTNDFGFYAFGGGGLGGGSSSCYFNSISADYGIISHPDTSLGYPGIQYIANVPDSLIYGDSIHFMSSFAEGVCCLWSTIYGMASMTFVNYWNNIGDHYIGVNMFTNADTIFGWIRVNILFSENGLYILSIKDYACNENLTSIIKKDDSFSCSFYPNPVKKILTVSLQENVRNGAVNIYDINGVLLITNGITHNTIHIDLGNIQSGVYFLMIEAEDKMIFEKIIKE